MEGHGSEDNPNSVLLGGVNGLPARSRKNRGASSSNLATLGAGGVNEGHHNSQASTPSKNSNLKPPLIGPRKTTSRCTSNNPPVQGHRFHGLQVGVHGSQPPATGPQGPFGAVKALAPSLYGRLMQSDLQDQLAEASSVASAQAGMSIVQTCRASGNLSTSSMTQAFNL